MKNEIFDIIRDEVCQYYSILATYKKLKNGVKFTKMEKL